MAWLAVYRISDGSLVSVGTTVASPLSAGMASVQFDPVAARTLNWNPATKAFDAPKPKSDALSAQEFLLRFTLAERLALRAAAKTDPVVDDILAMFQLSTAITSISPVVAQALTALANKGVLTANRATQIGDF